MRLVINCAALAVGIFAMVAAVVSIPASAQASHYGVFDGHTYCVEYGYPNVGGCPEMYGYGGYGYGGGYGYYPYPSYDDYYDYYYDDYYYPQPVVYQPQYNPYYSYSYSQPTQYNYGGPIVMVNSGTIIPSVWYPM